MSRKLRIPESNAAVSGSDPEIGGARGRCLPSVDVRGSIVLYSLRCQVQPVVPAAAGCCYPGPSQHPRQRNLLFLRVPYDRSVMRDVVNEVIVEMLATSECPRTSCRAKEATASADSDPLAVSGPDLPQPSLQGFGAPLAGVFPSPRTSLCSQMPSKPLL